MCPKRILKISSVLWYLSCYDRPHCSVKNIISSLRTVMHHLE
jgi:hypothetical protein